MYDFREYLDPGEPARPSSETAVLSARISFLVDQNAA
jgi:hypothetical protein